MCTCTDNRTAVTVKRSIKEASTIQFIREWIKRQTIIYKTLHSKLKIEQQEPHKEFHDILNIQATYVILDTIM